MKPISFCNKKYCMAVLLAFSMLCGSPPSLWAQQDNPLEILATAFRTAIEKVRPAVVSISAEKNAKALFQRESPHDEKNGIPDFPDIFKYFLPDEDLDLEIPKDLKRSWQGSGFIASPNGEIITNVHVVDGAEKLTATLDDGREIDAEVIAIDKETDIALIKLKEEGDYPYASLGDSDELEVGDWVLAIGNPFGLSQSVSQGIVSAKGRTSTDVPVGGNAFTIKDYIQTTAAINPGNSGGPLINMDGEVIGINNAIQTSGGIHANVGIGFVIPSNLVKPVIHDLKEYGKVKRGYIGVTLGGDPSVEEWFKQEYGITYGAIISEVKAGTPADKAGLKEKDLILAFNGEKIRDSGSLVNMVTNTPVGSKVTLTILRDGDQMEIELILSERPTVDELVSKAQEEIDVAEVSREYLGVKIETLTPESAKAKGYDESLKGVIVTDITKNSPAYDKGVRIGDVIDNISDEKIETKEAFERVLNKFIEKMKSEKDHSRVILLRVNRAGSKSHPRFTAPTITLN